MPTYLYEHLKAPSGCLNDQEFELVQPIIENALTECNHCGAAVRRLIAGSVHVTWKGGAPTSKNFV